MNKGLKRAIGLGIILLLCIIIIWQMGFHKHLTLTSLKTHRGYLENAVATNYPQSVLVYILVFSVIIALAIPGLPLLTLLGGFLFGFIPGGLYALFGAMVGTSISFLIIRYILANVIRGKYAQKLEKFNAKIHSQGIAWYLITMHLIGLIPYFVINTLAALAGVPFFTFLWTTFVGSIPIIFIYSFAGRQLYLIESLYDIFSPTIIILLLVLVIMALIPLFFRSSRSDVEV